MLTKIPSPEAQVEATNKCKVVVNDYKFLVVSPVKCHVSHVLKDVVVWMSHDVDVSVSWSTFRAESSKRVLCMRRVASQRLLDLLVDHHIDLDTSLSRSLDDLVQTPFLVEEGGTPHEDFRREPPVGDVNGLFGILHTNRDGPEVVAAINIPLDFVVVPLREERLKAMTVADGSSFAIGSLFMFLIMAMIWVDQVLKLSYLVLEMYGFDFGIVKLGVCPVLVILQKDVGIWSCRYSWY